MEEILKKEPPELPPSPPPSNYQHGYFKNNWKKMLVIYVAIGLVLYGAVYYFLVANKTSNPYSKPATKATTPSPTPDPTEEQKGSDINSVIDKAKNMLSIKLKLDKSKISVFSSAKVNWSDGSLGCPKPGEFYTQSIVSGYKIVLSSGGKTYNYHGADGEEPFLCENSN